MDPGYESQRLRGAEEFKSGQWKWRSLLLKTWTWIVPFDCFPHRMTHHGMMFAEDAFFNNATGEKCVAHNTQCCFHRKGGRQNQEGNSSLLLKQSQTLIKLNLIKSWAWSTAEVRSHDESWSFELWSGDLNNQDDLQPSRNSYRSIFLDWANLRSVITGIG
jgi:hypothetical protein